MNPLEDSKQIFQQLAGIDATGAVPTLIETHDAWTHNDQVLYQLTTALRAQLTNTSRPEQVSRRIAKQKQSLGHLVTTLPVQSRNAI